MSPAYNPWTKGRKLKVTAAVIASLGATVGGYYGWGSGSPGGHVNGGGGGGGGSGNTYSVANVWVDTTTGDNTCVRSSSPAAYDSTKACTTLQNAYDAASASASDTIVFKASAGYGSQQVIRGSSPKTSTLITVGCETYLGCTITGTLSLGQTTNCGCADGSAPSNILVDGFKVASGSLHASAYNSSYEPTNIQVENSRVYDNTAGSIGGCSVSCGGSTMEFDGTQNTTIGPNVEVGPDCCVLDGMRVQAQGSGLVPANVTINGVYVHDVYNSCTQEPSSVTNVIPCTGYGIGDGCSSSACEHVDAMQTTGVHVFTIENSRWYAAGNQTVFLSCYSGGSDYTNLTVVNNLVSTEATGVGGGAGFSIGNACTSLSGFVHIYYNTVQNEFKLYGTSSGVGGRPAAGTDYKVIGNVFGNNDTCTLQDTGGSTFNPTYAYDEYGSGSTSTCTGTGVFTGTPTFTSGTYPYDLHLALGSNAIDAAETSSCAASTDFEGATRPQGAACDIGGDER